MKYSLRQKIFLPGLGVLILIIFLKLISIFDSSWVLCYTDAHYGDGINHCERMISRLIPFLFLVPLSIAFYYLRFKEMNTKGKVLSVSSTYVLLFTILLFAGEMCHSDWCRVREDDLIGILFFILLPLLPVFLFSLITYKMKDEVFASWISFAKWYVPMLVVMTFLLQDGGGSGFAGAVSGWFNLMILGALYVAFIVVSLVLIISKSIAMRGKK